MDLLYHGVTPREKISYFLLHLAIGMSDLAVNSKQLWTWLFCLSCILTLEELREKMQILKW